MAFDARGIRPQELGSGPMFRRLGVLSDTCSYRMPSPFWAWAAADGIPIFVDGWCKSQEPVKVTHCSLQGGGKAEKKCIAGLVSARGNKLPHNFSLSDSGKPKVSK